MLLLKLACFYFAMKEILWPLFLTITMLKIVQAFNSTPGYLDDLLNIDNPYFGGIVG